MALSTWRGLASTLADERAEANASIPVFYAHGTRDEMISIERARRSREALESNGYAVEWHEYPMGHQVCQQEIDAISTWIARVL